MPKIGGGERWTLRTYATSPLNDIYLEEFGKLLGSFLVSRGFKDLDEVTTFLNPKLSALPKPELLKNLTLSAELIAGYIKAGKSILVYGDYDVDGMSGLTLASSFFDCIGYTKFEIYQPHRFDEGYGVHVSALERIHQSFPYDLVLTVDSGITATAPAKYLKDKEIPFVITDHHLPGSELPDTSYLVNPNQGTCESEMGTLCGTAVLFFLLAGVKAALGESAAHVKMDQFLDLVSLATIADQMELKSFNRTLVKEGLKRWPDRVRPGLQVLGSQLKAFEAKDLAFGVAPKLNAASRMGQAEKALRLLLAKDSLEAERAFLEVESLNALRVQSQALVLKEATLQAVEQAQESRAVLLVQGEEWAEGVLGIVAAKLVEEFNLPTMVMTKTHSGSLRGSMRCPSGFHCVSFLEGAKNLLIKFGGHAEAAGLEMEFSKLAAFEAYIKNIDFSETNSPRVVEFDGEIEGLPSLQEVEALTRTSPWGRGNPQPLFLYSGLTLKNRKVMKERHVKWDLVGGSAIAFGMEELCKNLETHGHEKVDALVIPEISEFRGRYSVQLRVMKIRAAS